MKFPPIAVVAPVVCTLTVALLTRATRVDASFATPRTTFTQKQRQQTQQSYASSSALQVSATPSPQEQPESSFLSQEFGLSLEDSHPIIRIGTGDKERIVNAFGLWCAAVSVLTGPVWMVAMMLVEEFRKLMDNKDDDNDDNWDPHRAIFDGTGKIWAKTWLAMTNCFPTVTGNIEQLQQGKGPCLYVANHASWLDIPVLCTVLDPVFKFIAKGELRKVPCIGTQLEGGQHILIDRDDRRSQLRTFKDGMAWLNKGVPIMAFPEGMRSPDGRLMEFKRGLFSLAVKTGVPIVPLTLSNTNAVMPGYSYFPVQTGAGKIHVHVGEAISVEGRTEAELEEIVRQEFKAHLPLSQQPPPEKYVHDQPQPQQLEREELQSA